MGHFAHYQVLTDNKVLNLPNLSPSGGTGVTAESQSKQRIIWNPANDISLDDGADTRPILCFNVDLDNADDFKLRVWILTDQGAQKTIFEWTYDGNSTRQIMEPFHLSWVNTGNNPIMFQKISGNGQVQIRNVIVMYQRHS